MPEHTIEVFAELAEMQTLITRDGMEETVRHYGELCRRYSDKVDRIDAVQFDSYYLDHLFGAYCKALKKARKNGAAALYFEYDMDNEWHSTFFVCPTYSSPAVGDDDWACDYLAAVATPGIYNFAKIYGELDGFCTNDSSTAATLLMIARTAQAVSAVVDRKPDERLTICIGFHDQDPVHRLRNGG